MFYNKYFILHIIFNNVSLISQLALDFVFSFWSLTVFLMYRSVLKTGASLQSHYTQD